MTRRSESLDGLKVAAPCAADWDSMAGDERVRFCGLCRLHVYDLSEMSRSEAAALVANTEGRLCARFYRRPDGTVMTKDCPVGLRAVRVRAARAAGVVFSAVVSLFTAGAARPAPGSNLQGGVRRPVVLRRVVNPDARDATATLTGTLYDPNGAVIAGAAITLVNRRTEKKYAAESDDEGAFRIEGLGAGPYLLKVAQPGFRVLSYRLPLKQRELVHVGATLDVAVMGEIVPAAEEGEY